MGDSEYGQNQRKRYRETKSAAVEEEFPNDPGLQQVRVARRIIAREAEREGLSYLQYIRSEMGRLKGSD